MPTSSAQPWWLQLPLEQGAHRLGPLPARVVVGSDPERCHVVLAARFGAAPSHVVLEHGDAGWTLTYGPGARHLLRWTDDSPGKPYKPHSSLQAGDTLAFGTGGPRLTLVQGAPRPTAPTAPAPPPPGSGPATARSPRPVVPPVPAHAASGTDLGSELQRQVGARALAGNAPLQQLDATTRRLSHGRWRDPVLWVSAGLALLTSLGAVTGAAWVWLSRMR